MFRSTLEKALAGDVCALVEMTCRLQTNTISASDLKRILTNQARDQYADYLLACHQVYCENKLGQAEEIIKYWAAKEDGFCINLLGGICDSLHRYDERNVCYQKAAECGNPLALINLASDLCNELAVIEMTLEYINKLPLVLQYINSAYKQLAPTYQKASLHQLHSTIEKMRSNFTSDMFYYLAKFYEGIGLKSEMYSCFHAAIERDGTSKYVTKMIKSIEKIYNENRFFKTKIDFTFLNEYLEFVHDEIMSIGKSLDKNVLTDDEKQNLINTMNKQILAMNTINHILEKKGDLFKPDEFNTLRQSYDLTIKIANLCKTKLENGQKPALKQG